MKKKVLRRISSTAMGALMFVCLPLSTFARTIDVSSQDGLLTIDLADETEDLILTGTNTSKGSVKLITVSGTDKVVILKNLSLDTSGLEIGTDELRAALSVIGTGNVTFELDGVNILKSSDYHAGLEKGNDGSLTIKDDNGTSGSLDATGGGEGGAGIGGGRFGDGNNIVIKSGTVTATSGEYGAGIGGGEGGDGTHITIENGTVTATGGRYGAGIGGGEGGDGTYITIENGTVTATGGEYGAGIGGGVDGDGTYITIENGTVIATSEWTGAGIGGGYDGDGTYITIENGTVIATGGSAGAGIGGGEAGDGTHITIENGTVTATGGDSGAGIGGGEAGDGTYITIENGTVIATGGWAGAGIGGGYNGDGTYITIENGTVNAEGGVYASGIGGGYNGYNGAGIGGGVGNIGEVTITGGTVIAIGGECGAGIGGGIGSDGSAITVSNDATIYAAGGVGNSAYGEGAAIGEGGSSNSLKGVDVTPDTSGLFTTGSITTFFAGTTAEQIKANPGSGKTIHGTIPDPNAPVEPTKVKKEQPPKKEIPVYTERSCIADVNVAALIAAALKADPNAKEITIEFGDNICLTPDLLRDLFADSRVSKNCLFSYKGKRYIFRVNAVNTASKQYADDFAALGKETDGMAGFLRAAEIFNDLNVTVNEIN